MQGVSAEAKQVINDALEAIVLRLLKVENCNDQRSLPVLGLSIQQLAHFVKNLTLLRCNSSGHFLLISKLVFDALDAFRVARRGGVVHAVEALDVGGM